MAGIICPTMNNWNKKLRWLDWEDNSMGWIMYFIGRGPEFDSQNFSVLLVLYAESMLEVVEQQH